MKTDFKDNDAPKHSKFLVWIKRVFWSSKQSYVKDNVYKPGLGATKIFGYEAGIVNKTHNQYETEQKSD